MSLSKRPRLRRLAVFVAFALLPVGAAQGQDAMDERDADITITEEVQNNEGHTENLDRHEGHTENIDRHEEGAENIDRHEEGAENIDRHETSSGTMQGRMETSERLEGVGHAQVSADQQLAAARAKLAAARARHARESAGAVAMPAAADPDAPAASEMVQDRWSTWTSRLDVARHRVGVAEAVVQVWDESYAKMIESDYPRGEARQKLIDSRETAKERLQAEEAKLPRLVEAARRAGVPPGVLAPYTHSDQPAGQDD